MIANYVNEQHDTWDQFLREFAYAIRMAVNETTGKTPAELFLGRKLITPFQKLVMVLDGTEFAVRYIERLFEEARRNTETKQEKWKKYYYRRRRDVQIKVNDWVLVAIHPLSSATRKVLAKFKPKSEGPFRVLDVKNNNVVIWKAGKRLTINVDQRKTQQGGPVRSRKGRERNDSPYIEERTRSSDKNARRRGNQQRQDQERRGTCTKKSLSLDHEVEKEKSPDRPYRGRHNKEDQFDPEKAEKGTIVHTSRSEQDQATRMPDDEVINNGKTRKGEERVQRNPCHLLTLMLRGMYFQGDVHHSLNELEARLQQIWSEMFQNIIHNLYASMPDRTASCIRAKACSTGSREDRHVFRIPLMDRAATPRALSQAMGSFARQQVSARTLRQRLQQQGLSARRPWMRLPLKVHNKQECLQ
ncbi:uncharacterized protein TNCV_4139741 [Trichonephila clavipes]|nr:uncharacterized protein TNCV_4139741 [Trichonephila clavipes]